MILPDLNLLIYANDKDSPHHAQALRWWEELMNGDEEVGLAWVVALGFVRISTNSRLFERPLTVQSAVAKLRSWHRHARVRMVGPGPKHFEVWTGLLESTGAGGNMTTDSHLAALAMEHRAELHSNDADFGRYEGLRWRNPLS
jgi:uncharacterized protein